MREWSDATLDWRMTTTSLPVNAVSLIVLGTGSIHIGGHFADMS